MLAEFFGGQLTLSHQVREGCLPKCKQTKHQEGCWNEYLLLKALQEKMAPMIKEPTTPCQSYQSRDYRAQVLTQRVAPLLASLKRDDYGYADKDLFQIPLPWGFLRRDRPGGFLTLHARLLALLEALQTGDYPSEFRLPGPAPKDLWTPIFEKVMDQIPPVGIWKSS